MFIIKHICKKSYRKLLVAVVKLCELSPMRSRDDVNT